MTATAFSEYKSNATERSADYAKEHTHIRQNECTIWPLHPFQTYAVQSHGSTAAQSANIRPRRWRRNCTDRPQSKRKPSARQVQPSADKSICRTAENRGLKNSISVTATMNKQSRRTRMICVYTWRNISATQNSAARNVCIYVRVSTNVYRPYAVHPVHPFPIHKPAPCRTKSTHTLLALPHFWSWVRFPRSDKRQRDTVNTLGSVY